MVLSSASLGAKAPMEPVSLNSLSRVERMKMLKMQQLQLQNEAVIQGEDPEMPETEGERKRERAHGTEMGTGVTPTTALTAAAAAATPVLASGPSMFKFKCT
jgi:hypothetical protein